jgi:hypothetical protein
MITVVTTRKFSSAYQIGRAVALRKYFRPHTQSRRILNAIVHSSEKPFANQFYDPTMTFDPVAEQCLTELQMRVITFSKKQ